MEKDEVNGLVPSKEEKQPIIVPYSVQKSEKKIICPVCGHANPEYTAMCKMCSNYL